MLPTNAESPGELLLRDVRVLDADGGFTERTDVLVRDGCVEHVGRVAESLGPGLDGGGGWLLPGFADCHLHLGCFTSSTDEMLALSPSGWALEVARTARQVLELGVTLARDPGSSDAGIRDGILTGAVPGPTLAVSGPPLGQTGGHSDGHVPNLGIETVTGFSLPNHPGRLPYLVDGPEEMRKAIRTQVRGGVDWIKLCTTGGLLSTTVDSPQKSELSAEEITMAVREADRAGIPVAAHAYGGEGLTLAVEAGVRSIEHGMLLTREQADLMAERDCWLVPTLVVVEELALLADAGAIPPSAVRRVREVHDLSGRQVEIARAAGVRIAMGSDLVRQGRNLEELALLGDAGMPAREVLLTATSAGAELLGMGGTHGSLHPGKVFDAVLLHESPETLDVFRTEGAVGSVFQQGRVVRGPMQVRQGVAA